MKPAIPSSTASGSASSWSRGYRMRRLSNNAGNPSSMTPSGAEVSSVRFQAKYTPTFWFVTDPFFPC